MRQGRLTVNENRLFGPCAEGRFSFFQPTSRRVLAPSGQRGNDQVGWCQEEEKRLVVYQQGGE
jgi:hypothetical protein